MFSLGRFSAKDQGAPVASECNAVTSAQSRRAPRKA